MLFSFICPKCSSTYRKIATKAPEVECSHCHSAMERVTAPPGVLVMETLDNGAMRRPLERLAEAPRLHRERIVAVEGDKG